MHRNSSHRLVSILLICPCASLFSHAQGATGVIAGNVQDSGRAILVSAKVEVQPGGRQAASDDQGQFRIPNLVPGQYTLTATYVGFKPYSATVNVSSRPLFNAPAAMTRIVAVLESM